MMKYYHFQLLLALTLIASCGSGNETQLGLYNSLDYARTDANILITRGQISKMMEISENEIPLLLDEKRDPLPCQVDDVDGDGLWDELFALVDLPAKGQKKVILITVPLASYPEFETRTNLRLGDASKENYPELLKAARLEGISYDNYDHVTSAAYQMEGPAWENDRVGFRNYLDQRNGMDIFGKTTSQMVLDSVGIAGAPSYHETDTWGFDILKVGTSLGAGGIGYLHNDSIYRVGDSGSGMYELVFEGSLRSRFKLTFSDWKLENTPLEVVQQIEITGGRHFYQSTVTYSGSELPLELVTGIVNMKSQDLHILEADPNHTVLFTHDAQAEDSTLLTMALMIPNGYLLEYGESKKYGEGITETYYAILDASPGDALSYRFYSLWENEDPRWASMDKVSAYLKSEAERWTQSVLSKGQQ